VGRCFPLGQWRTRPAFPVKEELRKFSCLGNVGRQPLIRGLPTGWGGLRGFYGLLGFVLLLQAPPPCGCRALLAQLQIADFCPTERRHVFGIKHSGCVFKPPEHFVKPLAAGGRKMLKREALKRPILGAPLTNAVWMG